MRERPENFTIDYTHPLAKELSFATLLGRRTSNTFFDYSGYGQNSTIVNNDLSKSIYSRSIGRYCQYFNGSTTYIDLFNKLRSPAFASDQSFTTVHWAYSIGSTGMLLSLRDIDSGNSVWDVAIGANGAVKNNNHFIPLMRYSNNTGLARHNATENVQNRWVMFTVRLNQRLNTFDAFVNKTKYTVSQTVNGSIDNTGYAAIGSERNWVASSYTDAPLGHFNGYISDTLIFKRALLDKEIYSIADPTNIMYSGLLKRVKIKYYGLRNVPLITRNALFNSRIFKSVVVE